MGTLPMTKLLSSKARKPSIESGRADYINSLRLYIAALWRGQIDLFDFLDSASFTIRRGFTRAFYEGAAECGVTPRELSFADTAVLETEINTEILYLLKFGNTITDESRDAGEKLREHTVRLPMWVNRYEMLRNLGRMTACADAKLEWVWNPIKEHCSDCGMLNGRVYRASKWNTSGWVPRGRNLACGGFKCGCDLIPTDKPITPGPIPSVL